MSPALIIIKIIINKKTAVEKKNENINESINSEKK